MPFLMPSTLPDLNVMRLNMPEPLGYEAIIPRPRMKAKARAPGSPRDTSTSLVLTVTVASAWVVHPAISAIAA